jgi:Ca-activated chloride channel family protein
VTFDSPRILWLAAAAPVFVVGLYVYDRAQRRRLATRLGELPVIQKVIATASPRRRLIKVVLQALALGGIMFALARPQIAGKRSIEVRGLDVVVALDVSKSMLVQDVGQTADMAKHGTPATRLGRARELALLIIQALPEDRVAPLVFAGAATQLPLTEDSETAEHFLDEIGPADLPWGSNLAEVFKLARCSLRPDKRDDLRCGRLGRKGGEPLAGESLDPKDAPKEGDTFEQKTERGKAVVIITDGGDADTETLREAQVNRELGIALFVIGVGSKNGGVVHEIDDEGNPTSREKVGPDGQTVISKRDDAGLKALAAAAGDEGRYVVASESGEVDPSTVIEGLRGLNRGLATKEVAQKKDIFQPFLFGSFMLLLIEAAISTRRRREFPEER